MVNPENLGRQLRPFVDWPETVPISKQALDPNDRWHEPIVQQAWPDLGEHPDHVKVYRGLETHPDNVDWNNLGQHWSLSPTVARYFSQREEEKGGDAETSHSTVIEGLIHKKHFMTAEHPGAREFWKKHMGIGHKWLGGDVGENELPVIQGAPVQILRAFKIPAIGENEKMPTPEEFAPPTSLGRA